MMRPKRHRNRSVLTLSALVVSGALVACGEEPPPVVTAPPPPPKPTAPPPPPVTSIADLMAKYDIDQRVNLPEELAPDTDVQRIAVLKFFDAFAKAQADGLKGALSPADAETLSQMTAGGDFGRACDPITRIDLSASSKSDELQRGSKAGSGPTWWPSGAPKTCGAVMAVFRSGGRVEAQLWVFDVAGEGKKVSKQQFHSIYQPMDIMSKVSGKSLRAAWATVASKELGSATEAEELPKPAARREAQEKPEEASGSTGGPMAVPPMRNRPKPGGIDPPRHMPGK